MRSVLSTDGARQSIAMSPGGKTPIFETCPLPSNISVTEITVNSAKISWNPITSAMYYALEYKLPLSTIWTRVATTTNSIILNNLKEATSYQFRLMTSCSSTAGNFTSISSFNTISSSGCTDIFEINDNRTAAKSIVTGTKNYASISSAVDEDWYKFTNSSLQKNVKVTLADLPADYRVELYC